MNLNQVTVPSRDLDAALAFYRALGLKLIVDARPDYTRLLCPDGGATFSVHLVDALPTGAGTAVYFECADLDARVARLVAGGIAFDEGPSDRPWRWREARLRDPDGNRVILYWAGADRVDPPWRVTGANTNTTDSTL